jgi:uncharacterized membrane protein YqjE
VSDLPDEPLGAGRRPSIGALVGQVSEQVSTLVRTELELAKAEATQSAKSMGAAGAAIAGAAVLAFFALGVLIAAAVLGIAEALPAWLAALIVGVALLVIAGIAAGLGAHRMKNQRQPAAAVAGRLKEDLESLKKGFTR